MILLASFQRIWQLSLLSFIIAALTGFLYRYGMLYPLPEWLNFANIRHAHSHLMFFNWVCPPVMVWMTSKVISSGQTSEITGFKLCFYVMIILGFLSYPFFLLYGYHSIAIGSAGLPFAAVISGLVMITWYWFGFLWVQLRKSQPDTLPILFFDGALAALIISSLGAWGVSVFQFTAFDSPLVSSALTHFFLAVFTEGWAVLGIFGLLWQKAGPISMPISNNWLWIPILIGSMLIFPYSLTQSLITPAMLIAAKTGLLLIVLSTVLNIWFLLQSDKLTGFGFRVIIGLLVMKASLLLLAILPIDIWPGEHGLRVLYLHILLLGIFSITIIEIFMPSIKSVPKNLFSMAVLLVLFSLITISGYWPASLIPPNHYLWIAVIAVAPVYPAGWIFMKTVSQKASKTKTFR